MKTVAITGATSFLGKHLLQRLLTDGCHVYALVRPTSANLNLLPIHENLTVVWADLFDIELPKITMPFIDAFFHLAWDGARGAARQNCEKQKQNYEANLIATCLAIKLNASVFIGAGSQAEYGWVSGPIYETTAPQPDTAYGKYKLLAYKKAEQLCRQAGMRFVWPRIFSLYGPGDFALSLLSTCADNMIIDKKIQLTGCEQLWDYLYITDAVDAYLSLVNSRSANGIYNLASGEVKSLKNYIIQMKRIYNSSSQLHFGALPYPSGIPTGFIPKVEKLSSNTDWTPKISFEQGILAFKDSRFP